MKLLLRVAGVLLFSLTGCGKNEEGLIDADYTPPSPIESTTLIGLVEEGLQVLEETTNEAKSQKGAGRKYQDLMQKYVGIQSRIEAIIENRWPEYPKLRKDLLRIDSEERLPLLKFWIGKTVRFPGKISVLQERAQEEEVPLLPGGAKFTLTFSTLKGSSIVKVLCRNLEDGRDLQKGKLYLLTGKIKKLTNEHGPLYVEFIRVEPIT